MADVFISYKRAERHRVERIANLLRALDMTVWFDAQLEAGRSEGFDAEIEREVTSAHCVLVCWTRDAIKSVYVRAEAKKGLERNALVPVLLEPCELPVPVNGVDAVDLTSWSGDDNAPSWQRVIESVRQTVDTSRADESRRRAQSRAAYERLDHKLYPGILSLLVPRIKAIGDWDTRDYREDIEAILSWIAAIAEKEKAVCEHGYELAERQAGGGAWTFWDDGRAAERAAQITKLRALLTQIDDALARSESLLNLPAP